MTRSRTKDIAALLKEEGELAEKDRDKRVRYTRVGRPPKPESERGQVYSIRIPLDLLQELRHVADRHGKAPAVLARDWIVERLGAEAGAGRPTPAVAKESSVPYGKASSRAPKKPRKRPAKAAAKAATKKKRRAVRV